ncbi:unnamed protein product [Enterobius vermicularis]|uniref:Transaldolase n=1 Tax=Enterobius vermicularis TaxID=51028 RepID=A0A0N4VEJ6_ENTVE|nr:unnamed protein product [Enterobius vermicularis]
MKSRPDFKADITAQRFAYAHLSWEMSTNIPLEGRSRLPQKIQDVVQESGAIVTQVVNSSRSNEVVI